MPGLSVLTIQSHVATGHVGNSAAVFALQRLGVTAWPVNTLAYSNHPGHASYRGRVATAAEIAELVEGIAELGLLDRCDAILSGYVPTPEIAAAVCDAVDRVKAANARALYCCDPVIGDWETGTYVPDDVADALATLCLPRADLLVPNGFELSLLTGAACDSEADVVAAAQRLAVDGRRVVVTTPLKHPGDEIEVIAVERVSAFRVATPRLALDGRPDGAGDLFAALLLGRLLQSRDLATASAHAASATYQVLEATRASGARDLALIAAQDALVQPATLYPVSAIVA